MDQPLTHVGTRLRLREPFCCISHGLGAVLGAAGTVVLVALAGHRSLYVAAFLVYGISLALLYSSSAIYHGLTLTGAAMDRLQRLDHTAIYLLIAGTYTPMCLLVLPSRVGLPMLTAQYVMATAGILITFFWKGAPHAVRVVLYVLMGWMVVLGMHSLQAVAPPAAIGWIVAGGLFYTVGTVIFATNWPHLVRGKFSAHDLWHVFVLAGSACHFYVVWRWVALPLGG